MDEFELARKHMVEHQLRAGGIKDECVLDAMARVPRHLFVPLAYRHAAYEDGALPIGSGQTISQPWIVAMTLQALRIKPTDRALEIGTGSGYQAALIGELAASVVTIERLPELARSACTVLQSLGYDNITVVVGDGNEGYPPQAPYDVIVVAAAASELPPKLVEQLADGGRMVIPVGSRRVQTLTLVEKVESRLFKAYLCECVFVPFIGQSGWPEEESWA